jgi:hypothetical protein
VNDDVAPLPYEQSAWFRVRQPFRKGLDRIGAINATIEHSWGRYKRFGWGSDELTPRSGERASSWGGKRNSLTVLTHLLA